MSGAVWLLTTRGRPELYAKVIEACTTTKMSSTLATFVDGSGNGYVPYLTGSPMRQVIHVALTEPGLAASMQWCLENYPDASHYGWLADDTFPRTEHFDTLLEQAAGAWGISYAADGWLSEDRPEALSRGWDMSSGLCWGGDLVRAVGRWAIPEGVRQAGIDVAWMMIARLLMIHRYTPSVLVEHWNWRTGKREKDATDDWHRDGWPYIERDLGLLADWRASDEPARIVERVRRAMHESAEGKWLMAEADRRQVDLDGTK